MKRLIRSKFFSAQGREKNNNYVEVFINPDSSEIAKIKQIDPYGAIRGNIAGDGTIYAWAGSFLHDDMKVLDNDFNLGSRMKSDFHFASTPMNGPSIPTTCILI